MAGAALRRFRRGFGFGGLLLRLARAGRTQSDKCGHEDRKLLRKFSLHWLRKTDRYRMCRRRGKVKSLGGLLDRAMLVTGSPLRHRRRASPAAKSVGEPIQIQIDHRRGEQSERLTDQQSTHHGIAERPA